MENEKWPTNEDLKNTAHIYDVRILADKLAEEELVRVAALDLSREEKALWLSNILTDFFMKGYRYAEYGRP